MGSKRSRIPACTIPVLAVVAAAALNLAACKDGPADSDPASDKAAIDADLREMSLKLKAFGTPDPPIAWLIDEAFDSAIIRPADPGHADCNREGRFIRTWMDTTVAGGIGTTSDTTDIYTDSDTWVCSMNDFPAYRLSRSGHRNDLYESWFQTRENIVLPIFNPGVTDTVTMSGSGRVRYFSGYEIGVESLDFFLEVGMRIDSSDPAMKMILTLDGGRYVVPLENVPDLDFASMTDPDPDALLYVGPIRKSGDTVGWFEVMGDKRVVIRDEAKNIVQAD